MPLRVSATTREIKGIFFIMEIWRDIKGYEGLYRISDLGNVKSLNYIRTGKEKLLKAGLDSGGYKQVLLSLNGKTKSFKVHKLVAIAFLNHTPNGHKEVVDHINNDKLDNRLNNLQITSNRENLSKDKFRKNPTSEHIGVYWHKKANKWGSRIGINGKQKHLGLFICEKEASKAYKEALNRIK